jgi:sigma-B regulation protein RsbU (phosphoserine phosphatase)
MTDFDVFKDERAALEQARALLESDPSPGELLVEFENLLRSYSKLFDISRRLVRMSDRNEETLKQANIRINKQKDQLERELEFARGVQMSMLPGHGHANLKHHAYQVYAYLRPARSVGGDLYYFRESERALDFIIGDVSDKGVPAALFMAKTVAIYNGAVSENLSPGQILTRMNNILSADNDACMFVTALCGRLDFDTGQLVISNAGHMNPVLHGDPEPYELECKGGTALGLIEGRNYTESEHHPRWGSRILMYTDGISEACNPNDELYDTRLFKLMGTCQSSDASSLATATLEDVEAFVDGATQSDDITLMVVQVGASG